MVNETFGAYENGDEVFDSSDIGQGLLYLNDRVDNFDKGPIDDLYDDLYKIMIAAEPGKNGVISKNSISGNTTVKTNIYDLIYNNYIIVLRTSDTIYKFSTEGVNTKDSPKVLSINKAVDGKFNRENEYQVNNQEDIEEALNNIRDIVGDSLLAEK